MNNHLTQTETQEKIEQLTKQYQQERLLKMQAVNKLAEIMNRKDMNMNANKKQKSSSADLRKKEKECRKLQQDLKVVSCTFKLVSAT